MVPLTVPLADALAAWRRQVARQRVWSEYVFTSRHTGKPFATSRVGRQFRDLLKRAGLGRWKLYNLRHTYASQLLDQGVKPVDVAALMGHKM